MRWLLFLLALTASADASDPCTERLKTQLRAEASRGFTGSVLVANGDDILLEENGGTAYCIASISKAITATAVLQLAEKEAVALDAPLSRYFPEAPPALAKVTVHHLLSHRSGLPHAYAADGIQDREAAARALLTQKTVGPLGSFAYSNDGYNLLAILIERVSGTTFESYVRTNIFERAGMTTASFWGEERKDAAPPYKPPQGLPPTVWRDGRSVANWGYRGATGIYATPRDLFHFARAFSSGRLVSPAIVALMTSSKDLLGRATTTYGYGWAIRFEAGKLTEYWHGGNESWLGHNGVLRVLGDRTYVVLSNAGDSGKQSWAGRVEAGLHVCK